MKKNLIGMLFLSAVFLLNATGVSAQMTVHGAGNGGAPDFVNPPDEGNGDYTVGGSAVTNIDVFEVSWDIVRHIASSSGTGSFSLGEDDILVHVVTAKGTSTWNTPQYVAYADLYSYSNLAGRYSTSWSAPSSDKSPHKSDLSGDYSAISNGFRFRLTIWQHGGYLIAKSNRLKTRSL
jgi:hypothetical protein